MAHVAIYSRFSINVMNGNARDVIDEMSVVLSVGFVIVIVIFPFVRRSKSNRNFRINFDKPLSVNYHQCSTSFLTSALQWRLKGKVVHQMKKDRRRVGKRIDPVQYTAMTGNSSTHVFNAYIALHR